MAQKSSSSSIVLPNIKESQEIKGILNFTLEQANVSIANAIRRTILSDIKMVVLNPKNIQIIKNHVKNMFSIMFTDIITNLKKI